MMESLHDSFVHIFHPLEQHCNYFLSKPSSTHKMFSVHDGYNTL